MSRKWWLPWQRRYVGDDQIVVPLSNASPHALPGETEADTIERLLERARDAHPTPMAHRCATCGAKDSHVPGCAENEPPDDTLPDGLYEKDGKVVFDCRGCGRPVEWEGDDFTGFDLDVAYGGCSPWCLP